MKKHQTRRLGARESERYETAAVVGMNGARVGCAGVRKKRCPAGALNLAQALFREHRTLIGRRHTDDGEGRSRFAVVWSPLQVRVDERAQRTLGQVSIAQVGRLIDSYFPALAAGVFAGGTDAAKAISVSGRGESSLIQDRSSSASAGEMDASHWPEPGQIRLECFEEAAVLRRPDANWTSR